MIRSTKVQSYASSSGINWHFIIEIAPWMEGFYEGWLGFKTLSEKICRTQNSNTDSAVIPDKRSRGSGQFLTIGVCKS